MTIDMPDAQPRGLATTLAAERIRDMIVEGQLAPGQRVPERIIGERLSLSRTPLREALKILAVEGLVVIEPNRGAVVTQLSVSELQSAFELLATLDAAAAELACMRATDAEIASIEALHATMLQRYHSTDLRGYFKTNQAIHQQIVDAAHNPALSRVYRSECARIDRYRFGGNRDAANWARAVAEHEHILYALRHRQGGVLREVMQAHRRSGWNNARAMLESG